MKFLTIALTSLFLLFANAEPASAAPIFAAVASFFATAFTSAAITTAITNLLISTALSALSAALMPKQKLGRAGITTDITLTGGDNPQSLIFGKYTTAGVRACPPMSFGFAGDGENEWVVDVITLADMPIKSLDMIIVDGNEYNLLPHVPGGAYYEGREFGAMTVDGKLNNRCFVRFYDGTQTAADPILVQHFGGYPERPWTDKHILTGIPYAIVFYKFDDKKYSGFPEAKFVVSGMPLYDPRKDSSVGGSGTHRWNDLATWEYTENPVVQIYNVIRGITLPDGSVYGLKAKPESIPLNKWFAAMNRCDQAGTGGDDMKRYRAALEFTLDTEPLEVIETLLTACSGMMTEYGGVYGITVGAPAVPTASFTDDELVITESRDFTVFEGLQQTFNGVTASYPDPAAVWETKEAVPLYNAAWEAQDDGRRLFADLRLPAVPYPKQVRRLMRELAADNRRTRKHSITLSPAFLGVNVLDTVSWTSQNNGYNAKLFEVISKTIDPNTLLVTLGLRERDPADYDFDSDFDNTLPVYPSAVDVITPVVGVTAFSANALLLNDAQGRPRRAAIQISWSPEASYAAVSYQIRHATTLQAVASGTVSDVRAGAVIVAEGVLPSTGYEVRARAVIRGRETQWSGWLGVSTGAASLVSDDFADGITTLFRDEGMYAIEYLATLPTTGAFAGQLVFNTTNGKLYRWVTSPAPAKWVAVIEGAIQGVLDETSFASGISIPRVVSTLPTSGNFEGRMVTLSTDGKLYRYHSGAWTAAVPAVDVTGQLTDAQIADITAAKLTGQITGPQIADSAITVNKILNSAVNASKLATNAVTDTKIAASAVTTAKIAVGAITSNTIAAGAITETKITDGAISTPKIAAGAVTANTIAAGAVTANNIAAGAIVADKIASGAITSEKITAGAIGADQIAANAIVASKMAIADFTNLVPDSEITDVASWGLPAGVTISTAASLIEYDATTTNKSVYSGMFPVKPGDTFFVAANTRLVSGTTANVRVQLRYYDQNKANLSWSPNINNTIPGIGVIETSGEAVIPTGAYFARFYAHVLSSDGTVRLTKPVVRLKNGGELIVDGAITAAKIGVGAVTANSIAAEAITSAKIDAGAITTAKLAAGAVTANTIAANAITSAKIAAGAVEANNISANAITSDKIDANAITSAKIAAGAIGADQIAANAIVASKIAITDNENKVPDDQLQDKDAWVYTPTNNIMIHYPTTASGSIKSVGSWYYKYDNNTTRVDGQAYTKGFFPVTPGDVLYLSGQMIRAGGTKMYARMTIIYYDKNDAQLTSGAAYDFAVVNGTANSAAPYVGEHTVPNGAYQARFRFFVHGLASETDGNVHFGAPIVRTKNKGEMIVDGTITGDKIVAQTIHGGLIAAAGVITSAAQINNAVITNAKIADLAVNTLKIADNAASTAWGVNSHQITIDLAYPATLIVLANVRVAGVGSGYTATYNIKRNGSPIESGNYSVSAYTWRMQTMKTLNVPAGTHTFTQEYSGNAGDYSEHRFLILGMFK